jgi:hypothetical protein
MGKGNPAIGFLTITQPNYTFKEVENLLVIFHQQK